MRLKKFLSGNFLSSRLFELSSAWMTKDLGWPLRMSLQLGVRGGGNGVGLASIILFALKLVHYSELILPYETEYPLASKGALAPPYANRVFHLTLPFPPPFPSDCTSLIRYSATALVNILNFPLYWMESSFCPLLFTILHSQASHIESNVFCSSQCVN